MKTELELIAEAYVGMYDSAYELIDLEHIEEEFDDSIDEGVGALAGLSKHLIKTAVGRNVDGGENSEVEDSGHIKKVSDLKKHVSAAMAAGHMPVIHIDGKPVSAISKHGSFRTRQEYEVHDTNASQTQREYIKPQLRRGYTVPGRYQDTPAFNKSDAQQKAIGHMDGEFLKNNKVSVKTIKGDALRAIKHDKRVKNQPVMQTNYVNKTDDKKKNDNYFSSTKKETSRTPFGDMSKIKNSAALKLADKKLGSSPESAKKTALDIHAEIGKHLEAGYHDSAKRAISKLVDHISTKGLTTSDDKKQEYAKNLKELKSNWGKEYAKKRLARMRGEVVENLGEDVYLELFEEIETSIE